MPRILPFWQSVFAHLKVPVSYVIACRNPMSVARSLAKRDRFDLEKGYFLWLEHTICSLTRTADQNRIVVDYDRLMEDPALQLERMAQCLGVTFDPEGPEFDAFSRLFLEESLRHSRFHPEDVDLEKSAPPSAAALYKVLDGLAGDAVRFEDPEVVSLVDRISALVDENYTALGYLRACEERILSGLHQVALRDARIGELTTAVSERDGRIADFQRLVSQREAQVAELTGTVSERDVQVADLTAAVSERDGRIADFQRLVSQREAQAAELTGAVSQRDDQIGNLKQVLEVAHGELNRIYTSNSWKLTTPLRFFRRSLITRPYWFFRKMSSDSSRWCWHRLPAPVQAKQKFKTALHQLTRQAMRARRNPRPLRIRTQFT